MRWELASMFAFTAMSAACYGPNTVVCDNGVLCPEGQACTGNDPGSNPPKPLCGDEGNVAVCAGAAARSLCMQSNDTNGLCIDSVCSECKPELFECRYGSWTPVAVPVQLALQGVYMVSPDRAYAVGGQGAALTYDGASWTVGIEGISGTVVAADSLNDVWASNGQVFVSGKGVYRNDGSRDPAKPTGFADAINSIWGLTVDNIAAVGGSGTKGTFNGSAWSWVSSADPILYGSWGWGASIVAVGLNSAVRFWKNDAWTNFGGPQRSDSLFGVWGKSDSDFYAVGNQDVFPYAGVIWHLQGTQWSEVGPVGAPKFTGIWGSTGDEIYVVGDNGAIYGNEGAGWTRMSTPDSATFLVAIAGSGRDAVAVGNNGAIWRLAPP